MNEKQLQNRLQSPVFWTAALAQVLSVLVFTGVLDTGTSAAISNVITAVCQLLVLFGIFNDPTNQKGI